MKPFDEISLSKKDYQRGWVNAYSKMTSEYLWKEEPIEFLPEYMDKFKEWGVRHVLDVGCGDGRNMIFLLRNGFHVTGIDLSAIALANALAWTERLELNGAVFLHIDIESFPWPFPESSFDALVCLDVFGQILEIDNLVNNFYRVVSPGGYVITNLYTPRDAAFGMGEKLGEKTFLYKNTLWRFFTEEDIMGIFSKFDIVSIKPLAWADPPHPGYRDQPHTHDSYIVLLRKNGRR